MLISSFVQLGAIFCYGVQNTFLSWMYWLHTASIGYTSGGADIRIRIYGSCDAAQYEDFQVDDSVGPFQSHLYSTNRNTVILALPYLTKIEDEDNQEVIRALCKRCEFNIIVLDNSCSMNTNNIISYPSTMLQVYTDAKRYANVFNRAMDFGLLRGERIYGLGYSLGAQVVGHVCRLLNQPCGHLYAFDPAGPLYMPGYSGVPTLLPHLKLVSSGDADLVVSVGCNEGVIGTPFHSGDINVHVNGGTFQPGCQALSLTCNHRFCRKVMIDSITSSTSCQARICKSKNWFDSGLCKEIFTLSLPTDIRTTYRDDGPADAYMDTLKTDSCQGYMGSVQYAN